MMEEDSGSIVTVLLIFMYSYLLKATGIEDGAGFFAHLKTS